ncbi:uncharacterized protein LOC135475629 [Liolophura sinensis]|uniref:uncharacterized protein LOC135475629 n=1 Tax=Liolophura sinensis TaxID=3198878 RepID=UPI0031584483
MDAYEKYYSKKVDEKTMERIKKGFKVYWEEVILGKFGKKDEVTEDEFVASMTKEYQSNPEGFRQTVRHMFEEIIGTADVDGNKMVNFEEFYVLFCAFGHSDKQILKRMFNDYGPTKKNEISLADMTESWVDILVGEDPNKVNVVINAFTEGAAPGTIAM